MRGFGLNLDGRLACHDVYGHDEGVGLFAGWRGRFRQNASVGVAGMWRP